MEKSVWERPRVVGQMFEANEYVAACYSLYCEVSGDNHHYTTDTWFGQRPSGSKKPIDTTTSWAGTQLRPDGQLHGRPCAEGSSANDKGEFFEYHKKSAVGSISILGSASDGSYYAIWTSNDINGTGTYNHYGYAVLDDENRPNHS